MKQWKIEYPGEYGQEVTEIWTEDQILQSYWDRWQEQMYKAGKEDLISKDRCILDWVTTNWASQILQHKSLIARDLSTGKRCLYIDIVIGQEIFAIMEQKFKEKLHRDSYDGILVTEDRVYTYQNRYGLEEGQFEIKEIPLKLLFDHVKYEIPKKTEDLIPQIEKWLHLVITDWRYYLPPNIDTTVFLRLYETELEPVED